MSPIVRRIAIVVIGLCVAGYLAVVAIWVSPSNIVRDEVYPSLKKVMVPHLQQGWALFARGLVNSDKTIRMRAVIDDGHGPRTTEWVDLGELEWDIVRHSLTQTRDARTVFKLAIRMQTTYPRLPEQLRAAIGDNVMDRDGIDLVDVARERDVPLSSVTRARIANWTDVEKAARGLLSLYAYHLWGADVRQVQWKAVITPVTRFDDRGTEQRPAPAVYEVGWRSAVAFPAEVRAAWR